MAQFDIHRNSLGSLSGEADRITGALDELMTRTGG